MYLLTTPPNDRTSTVEHGIFTGVAQHVKAGNDYPVSTGDRPPARSNAENQESHTQTTNHIQHILLSLWDTPESLLHASKPVMQLAGRT